jgi:hypothetical protein
MPRQDPSYLPRTHDDRHDRFSRVTRDAASGTGPELRDLEIDAPAAERVGGKRIVRREIVAAGLGAIFIAAALLKPWGGVPSPPTQPSPATATPRPAATPIPAQTAGNETAPPAYDPIDARGVDWSALAMPDGHDRWGIATATLAPPGPGPTALSGLYRARIAVTWASITWTPGATSATVTLPVSAGRRIYGLAVTWPRETRPKDLGFIYESPESGTSNQGGLDGFPAGSELAVVAGGRVVSPRSAVTGTPVVSGQFWVAPVDAISVPFINPPADSWRFGPWWWPDGKYQVRIGSGATARTVVVHVVTGG